MATPGSVASFEVDTDEAASSIKIVPCDGAEGYGVDLAGRGLEAPAAGGPVKLSIEVPRGAPMA